MFPLAADLPGIEPDPDDLRALEQLPWRQSQEHIESLLSAAALLPVRRAVVSPIRRLGTVTAPVREGRAA